MIRLRPAKPTSVPGVVEVTAGGTSFRLTPAAMIGSGGEAEIYDVGAGVALKLFKAPEHPDYAASRDDQAGARLRIEEHQRKLPALLGRSLPNGVVGPRELVFQASPAPQRRVIGYTMPLVLRAEPLLRYGDRAFRQTGVCWDSVINIYRDLHRLVSSLHATGIVIGDFNDLNVLVRNETALLIDADSMQFPPFACSLFTARFLDPLLTDGRRLTLDKPPNSYSDWYAYTSMLLQALLFVGPYGGVFRPRRSSERLTHGERPLARVTIFHPEVLYPRHAIPFACLPDALLHFFSETFMRDARSEFPLALLEGLRWTRCRCGTEHARPACPNCTTTSPQAVRLREVIRGRVTCTELFRTTGTILAASVCNGVPLWLAHEAGRYVREDGSVVFEGAADPRTAFHLLRGSTFVARDGQAAFVEGDHAGQTFRADSLSVSSVGRRFWVEGGSLFRDGRGGVEAVGSVLEHRTRIWSGENFGFGFYRAGRVTVAFVFDATTRGINDSLVLPPFAGELVDTDVAFAADRCWFLTTTQERGRLMHRCAVIRRDGRMEAVAEAESGTSDWLHRIHGNAAAGQSLFVATDAGVTRVEINGSSLAAATYPDTEPFVDGATRLFAAAHGLYAVDSGRVLLLSMT